MFYAILMKICGNPRNRYKWWVLSIFIGETGLQWDTVHNGTLSITIAYFINNWPAEVAGYLSFGTWCSRIVIGGCAGMVSPHQLKLNFYVGWVKIFLYEYFFISWRILRFTLIFIQNLQFFSYCEQYMHLDIKVKL